MIEVYFVFHCLRGTDWVIPSLLWPLPLPKCQWTDYKIYGIYERTDWFLHWASQIKDIQWYTVQNFSYREDKWNYWWSNELWITNNFQRKSLLSKNGRQQKKFHLLLVIKQAQTLWQKTPGQKGKPHHFSCFHENLATRLAPKRNQRRWMNTNLNQTVSNSSINLRIS